MKTEEAINVLNKKFETKEQLENDMLEELALKATTLDFNRLTSYVEETAHKLQSHEKTYEVNQQELVKLLGTWSEEHEKMKPEIAQIFLKLEEMAKKALEDEKNQQRMFGRGGAGAGSMQLQDRMAMDFDP